MAGKLNAYVHVRDAKSAAHVFGPDSVVPEWAEKLITNPKAWDSLPAEREEPKSAVPFSQMNKESLENVASAEGVDVSKATTNKEIRDAITAHRGLK